MKRINRLYRIVNHLMAIKNQPGINIQEMAKKCHVSPRTIYRDISILVALGVPISMDGGLNLSPHLFIPSINFTLTEAMYLRETTYSLLEKEHQHETLEHIIEKINSAIYLQNSPLYSQNKDLFSVLKEYLLTGKIESSDDQKQKDQVNTITIALADSSYLEVSYVNPVRNVLVDEILQPLSLIYQKKGWIMLAKQKNSPTIKNIRIDTIQKLKLTNLKYKADQFMIDYSVQVI